MKSKSALLNKTVIINIESLVARAADFNMRPASIDEISIGITVAEELMNEKIATFSSVRRMHKHTGMTAWVTGHPVDGVFLILPLTSSGELAVRDGTYHPADPNPAHLCPPGEPCSAMYVGVYAGRTQEARKSVMTSAAVMRIECFASIPCFARGATEDGRRSMESLGLKPYEGGLPDLYVQEALTVSEESAA